MKIRNGFVSNSSSSSFIVVSKVDKVSGKNMLYKFSKLHMSVNDNPFRFILEECLNVFVNSITHEFKSLEEYLEWIKKEDSTEDIEEIKDWHNEEIELLKRYGNLSIGTFNTDEGGIEQILCEYSINWSDEEILIISK